MYIIYRTLMIRFVSSRAFNSLIYTVAVDNQGVFICGILGLYHLWLIILRVF